MDIIIEDGGEEVIDYDLTSNLSFRPTTTLMSPLITYGYTLNALRLIANAHQVALTTDELLINRVLIELNKNNGICKLVKEKGLYKKGLDYMCPCKEFRETGKCFQKIFKER